MDPRRVQSLQRRAQAVSAAFNPADSSESEAEVGSVRRAGSTPSASSPGSPQKSRGPGPMPTHSGGSDAGGGTAANTAAANREYVQGRAAAAHATVDLAQLKTRAGCAALLQVPLLVLMVLFSNDLEKSGYAGIAWPPTLLGIFGVLAIIAGSAELAVASKLPLAGIFFLQGCVSGLLYPLVADAPILRGGAMVVIGYIAGNLRFLWGTRRLSRRMPHTMGARIANFVLRSTGLMPAFVIGETGACALFAPEGWLIISQSWYGYVLVIAFPYLLVLLSSGSAWIITRVFGGDREHVIGRSDVTRMQLVRWMAAVVMALVSLIGVVGYVFITFGGHVWGYQLLMSPYGAVVDVVTYKALKAKERRAPQQLVSGREAYKSYTRRHAKLITDVMGRPGDFHTH